MNQQGVNNQIVNHGPGHGLPSSSLLLVFILSAVMIALELLFPLALFYLPDRSGVTAIIAIVMLGLGLGGILYYLVHDRIDADRWAIRSVTALPFFILAAYLTAALIFIKLGS